MNRVGVKERFWDLSRQVKVTQLLRHGTDRALIAERLGISLGALREAIKLYDLDKKP